MTATTETVLPVEDAQLIRDTLDGQTEAFGQLVLKHQKTLHDLALRMVGQREEAEDIVQQVFVEAYRHLSDFRYGSQFSTWLYSITLNRSRNHLRSRKTRFHVSLDKGASDRDDQTPLQLPDPLPPPEKVLEKQFDLEWIRDELQSLSKNYQDIFTLHYFQDLSIREIAERVQRPEGTIKVYLHRARKLLLQQMSRPRRRSIP